MITRLTRRVLVQRIAITLMIAACCHLSAAAASAAPLGDFADKLNELTTQFTTFGRAITFLSIVIVFMSWVAEPAIPQWARENKGIFARVLMGAFGLGLTPDIVSFIFG